MHRAPRSRFFIDRMQGKISPRGCELLAPANGAGPAQTRGELIYPVSPDLNRRAGEEKEMEREIRLVVKKSSWRTGGWDILRRGTPADTVILEAPRADAAYRIAKAIAQAYLDSFECDSDPKCKVEME